jgi:LPS-assembly lipoprotein
MKAKATAVLRRGVFVGAAVGVLGLAGCGFTPMYAQSGMGGSLDDISVQLSDHTRSGFLLQQRLNDAFGRHDEHASWKLLVDVSSRRTPRGLRVNNVASRYEMTMNVNFELRDAATNKVALKDQVSAMSTYDSADQPYAGLAAEQDGEARVAAQAADLLRLRLLRYFAARPTP